jgi:hypothetical protein
MRRAAVLGGGWRCGGEMRESSMERVMDDAVAFLLRVGIWRDWIQL